MANYTPTFSKPYPSGWVDKPSKTTPVTAAIMNSYDTAIAALEAYLRDNAIDTVSVSVEQFPSDGRQWLGTITVGNDQYRIYMPSLKYENSVSDGIKIGTITLGEQSFDVYAPSSSAGGSTVSVAPKTLTGTNIAEITVDGTTYQLYAPTGGGSGSTVTAEATLTEGTQIGKITIDGTETILYAPTASPITVDSELSATSENAIQNKAVDAAVKNLQQQIDAGGTGGSITVDSALSTTSENPVQNKAIAEEFQKYANGTKVAAKATEAETAKTAASATTAQSATTAESATKATQDAQGNTIDTTYAKKTEIPQGTVVDDALSSTSANPVQNKVVKAEFDRVNSNLAQLEYGEESGSGNLCDEEFILGYFNDKGQEVSSSIDIRTKNYIKVKPNTTYYLAGNDVVVVKLNESKTPIGYILWRKSNVSFTTDDNTHYIGLARPGVTTYSNDIAIIEGASGSYVPYIPSVKMLADEVNQQKNDLSNLKDATTPVAKAVADEDGNNIKSTYAKKTETFDTVTEDVNVVLNSDLFDSTYSYITCIRIGKLCVLSFTIRVKNTISSTIDEIVLMTIVGTKYQPKKTGAGGRQIFQGFAVGNYDENGEQSQSLNNTVRIITSSDSNYTQIITRDKDRINWSGYVQGQIMWVTD